MSDTKTPQGILCVIRQFSYELEDMLETANPLFVLLEDIQDPGNLENFLDCVFSRLRNSLRRQPAVVWPPHITKSKPVYAAHLRGAVIYDTCDYKRGTAFLIGNEANGLREETADAAVTAHENARHACSLSGPEDRAEVPRILYVL